MAHASTASETRPHGVSGRASVLQRAYTVFTVALCCATAFSDPVRIAAINIEGNEAISLQQVLDTIAEAVVVGAEVEDLDACLAQVTRLLEEHGRFSKVDVKARPAPGGQEILIGLAEYKVIAAVDFTGNTVLSAHKLSTATLLRPGLLLKPQALTAAVERIEAAYEDAGASAFVTDVNVTDNAEITFVIRERTIERFVCEGLQVLTCEEVREVVGVTEGAPLLSKALTEGLKRLKSTGWFDEVGLAMEPGEKDPEAGIVVAVAVKESEGIVDRAVGHPLESIDKAKLREDVAVPTVLVAYEVSMRINDYLLDVEGELAATLERLSAAAQAVDREAGGADQAAILLEYGLALDAANRGRESDRQCAAAAEMYRRLLAAEPANSDLATGLGRCLTATGEYEEALEALARAIELDPGRWEPRVHYAWCASYRVMREHLSAAVLAGASGDSMPLVPTTRAAIELSSWPRLKEALLAAIGAEGEPDELTRLAREANAQLQQARRLAPESGMPLRAMYGLLTAGIVGSGVLKDRPGEWWDAVTRDAEEFHAGLGALVETDVGVALLATFFRSFRAMLLLMGYENVTEADQEIIDEFRLLAARLEAISEKWPQARGAAGGMLGMLQLLAGEREMATATFETALRVNPYDRQTYSALLGGALLAENFEEAERIVRRRLAATPAAEDYILLGKTLDLQGKDDATVLEQFRTAIVEYPEDPIGYVATAGWLLSMGGDDAEAAAVLDKGLALDPRNARGHAVRAALALLNDDRQQAAEALARALRADPKEDLVKKLRREYFTAPESDIP